MPLPRHPSVPLPSPAARPVSVISNPGFAAALQQLHLVDPLQMSTGEQRLWSALQPWLSTLDENLLDATHGRLRSSDRRLAGRQVLWLRWVVLEAGARGCVELGMLPVDDLADLVVDFVQWNAEPLADDHELHGVGRRSFGQRKKTDALRPRALRPLAAAVLRWADDVGRDDLRTVFRHSGDVLDRVDLARCGEARQKVELTIDMLDRVLDVLDAEDVHPDLPPDRRRAWHARQKAAVLVMLWGLPRVGDMCLLESARVRLSADRSVFVVNAWMAKQRKWRDLKLPVRGDRYCPVQALNDFLEAAHHAGYDLGGWLLPDVRCVRRGGAVVPLDPLPVRSGITLRRVLRVAGVEPNAVDQVLGTNALRRVLPSRAAADGKGLPFIQALGGWTSDVPADHYVVAEDGSSVVDDLLSELPDEGDR